MVCRSRRDDAELVRAARGADGSWYTGRGPGRGMWWCRDAECGLHLQVAHVARATRSAARERDVAAIRVLEGLRRSGERQ